MLRSLKRRLASWYLPSSLRWRGMRRAYMQLLGHLAADPEPSVHEGLRRASAQLGVDLALDLTSELGLGDSLADADAAWAVGCQAFGLGYTRTAEAGAITYDHAGCALWRFFADRGECHCRTVCLPMVETLTATLAPSVTMTVDREPTLAQGCRKSLRA